MDRLSPIDLEHAEIPKSWRGLDEAVTRTVLKSAAEEIARLRHELSHSRQHIASLEQAADQYRGQEALLAEALMLAKSSADACRQAASREAELIIENAKSEARAILSRTEAEREEAERSLEFLRRQRAIFDQQFRNLLSETLSHIGAAVVTMPEAIVVGER